MTKTVTLNAGQIQRAIATCVVARDCRDYTLVYSVVTGGVYATDNVSAAALPKLVKLLALECVAIDTDSYAEARGWVASENIWSPIVSGIQWRLEDQGYAVKWEAA